MPGQRVGGFGLDGHPPPRRLQQGPLMGVRNGANTDAAQLELQRRHGAALHEADRFRAPEFRFQQRNQRSNELRRAETLVPA